MDQFIPPEPSKEALDVAKMADMGYFGSPAISPTAEALRIAYQQDLPAIVKSEVERAFRVMRGNGAGEAPLDWTEAQYLAARFGAPEEKPSMVGCLGTCANCGHLDVPLDANYCPKCGAGRTTPAPSAATPEDKTWVVCTACPCARCQDKDAFLAALARQQTLYHGKPTGEVIALARAYLDGRATEGR